MEYGYRRPMVLFEVATCTATEIDNHKFEIQTEQKFVKFSKFAIASKWKKLDYIF